MIFTSFEGFIGFKVLITGKRKNEATPPHRNILKNAFYCITEFI